MKKVNYLKEIRIAEQRNIAYSTILNIKDQRDLHK